MGKFIVETPVNISNSTVILRLKSLGRVVKRKKKILSSLLLTILRERAGVEKTSRWIMQDNLKKVIFMTDIQAI